MFKSVLVVALLLSIVHVDASSHRMKNLAHIVIHSLEKFYHMSIEHIMHHKHEGLSKLGLEEWVDEHGQISFKFLGVNKEQLAAMARSQIMNLANLIAKYGSHEKLSVDLIEKQKAIMDKFIVPEAN